MDLLKGFFKFLKTQRLSLEMGNPTLLAISGGLDSVVLAHLFQQSNLPFAIAHCNFQLRGAESDRDELFVQKIALDFEVPFFVKCFETREYAEKNGLSIQMAARELRYTWFAEIAAENDFDHIAVAHHLNDSVETALLNFIRGT
ncbi:MAG: tRNA lysidine(34) synthetase TilS, partial [Saprospiraceae bacterium]|nr:tRNA lysidine(34) synthetase TilS [Saprospiraceae bacterium]